MVLDFTKMEREELIKHLEAKLVDINRDKRIIEESIRQLGEKE